MLDDDHLDASTARVMYDLGMGCGKLCMQAFLQYPNLVEVVGVELSTSRASVGMEALERLYEQQHDSNGVRWQLDVNTHPPYATLTATSRKLQIKQSKRGAEQVIASLLSASMPHFTVLALAASHLRDLLMFAVCGLWWCLCSACCPSKRPTCSTCRTQPERTSLFSKPTFCRSAAQRDTLPSTASQAPLTVPTTACRSPMLRTASLAGPHHTAGDLQGGQPHTDVLPPGGHLRLLPETTPGRHSLRGQHHVPVAEAAHAVRRQPTHSIQPLLAHSLWITSVLYFTSREPVACVVSQDDHFAASWGNARFSIYRKVL